MTVFIKNPNRNKAWNRLISQGHNPNKFMYMYSENSEHHLFKHIYTRKYLHIFVKEEIK